MPTITVYVPAYGELLHVLPRPGESVDYDRVLNLHELPPRATREEAVRDAEAMSAAPLTRRIIERTYSAEGETFEKYKWMVEKAFKLGTPIIELGSISDRKTLGDRHYRYPDGMERMDKVTKP